MRALVLLHRWLGIGVCALFAMWFASGIVMHLVPFPSLTDSERFAGLSALDASRVRHGVGEAVVASGITDARRVRLVQRADGPVYIIAGSSRMMAIRAENLTDARVTSESLARQLATTHAQRRGLDVTHITSAGAASHDQWTVPNGYDPYRSLYKIALNDKAATELYVSSVTGEIVLDTTRFERGGNYAGSVVHWIYPTILRSNWTAWDRTVWTVSFVALVAALTGAVLGFCRLRRTRNGFRSSFRGWHAWHHVLGLICATFVVTWIFSGWLSMDHGRLFSRGQLSDAESAALTPVLDVKQLSTDARLAAAATREIEWFTLGDHISRRERTGIVSQTMASIGSAEPARPVLTLEEIAAAVGRVASNCGSPVVVQSNDSYPVASSVASGLAYRAICGEVWFHIDGANGVVIERLDPSRRAYRWAYTALHTLNVPIFANHRTLRSVVIISLCLAGLMFSITGIAIGWRRLRRQF